MSDSKSFDHIDIRVAAYESLEAEDARALYARYVQRGVEVDELKNMVSRYIEKAAHWSCEFTIAEVEVKELKAQLETTRSVLIKDLQIRSGEVFELQSQNAELKAKLEIAIEVLEDIALQSHSTLRNKDTEFHNRLANITLQKLNEHGAGTE